MSSESLCQAFCSELIIRDLLSIMGLCATSSLQFRLSCIRARACIHHIFWNRPFLSKITFPYGRAEQHLRLWGITLGKTPFVSNIPFVFATRAIFCAVLSLPRYCISQKMIVERWILTVIIPSIITHMTCVRLSLDVRPSGTNIKDAFNRLSKSSTIYSSCSFNCQREELDRINAALFNVNASKI